MSASQAQVAAHLAGDCWYGCPLCDMEDQVEESVDG